MRVFLYRNMMIAIKVQLYEARELKSDGTVGDAPQRIVQTEDRREANLQTP